jgi:hypothetical protein
MFGGLFLFFAYLRLRVKRSRLKGLGSQLSLEMRRVARLRNGIGFPSSQVFPDMSPCLGGQKKSYVWCRVACRVSKCRLRQAVS